MTWLAIYEEETGRLVSVATEVADPVPQGLGVLECGEEMPKAAQWDAGQRAFVTPVEAAPLAVEATVEDDAPGAEVVAAVEAAGRGDRRRGLR